MKLHKIGIGNYRSIGDDPIWINLEKKVNIFIGTNNSGKSNVLKAFEWIIKDKQLDKKLDQIELHKEDGKNLLRILLNVSFEEKDRVSDVVGQNFIFDFRNQGRQKEWLAGPFDVDDNIHFKVLNGLLGKYENKYFVSRRIDGEEFQKTAYRIYDRLCNEIIGELPSVWYIPQFRQIIPRAQYSIKGEGIIEMLASWQHPEVNASSNIEKFLKIQNLLRRLLNSSDIQLEVVHSNDKIIVKNKDLRLPLESYGTGVHELIILAVAVYSHRGVFLIEEPEIHLHPKLQKEFLNFLIKETDNTYLITTHSNALIQPSSDVDVVHLTLVNGSTKGRLVESSVNILDILNDLGIEPSDILQANSVIWVEGPSDRIYLNKWIELFDPTLVEGIDYSIMFYGGKLLSHLSMERDNLPDSSNLINLLRINQKSIILIDSDKKSKKSEISETKSRIKEECKNNDIYCWITDGREIENYLSSHCITSAYKELTGIEKDIAIKKHDDLEKILQSSYGREWKKAWSYDASKPAIARIIIKHICREDISGELERHLINIFNVIKRQAQEKSI